MDLAGTSVECTDSGSCHLQAQRLVTIEVKVKDGEARFELPAMLSPRVFDPS